MSPEQDLSSKCAVSQDMKSRIGTSDAQAAVGFVQVQNPVYQELNSDSPVSVTSQVQDSACDSAEDLLNPEDKSGTEHPDLPQVPHPAEHNWRDSICESEMRPRKDEAVVEIPKDALGAKNGSATRGIGLPQLSDPAGHRQGEAAPLFGQSECQPRDRIGEKCQDGSGTRNKQKITLGRYLARVKRIRSHPVLTLVLIVLLLLVVALAVSLAAVSGRTHRDTPVTSDTPRLLACPDGWVGYNRICYFLSEDRVTWDQAQAGCPKLNTTLAVLKDKEIEFLFRFSRSNDYWLGLRTQDQRLQWVDGSNFNSSFPVQGEAGCAHLAENDLRIGSCSNKMQYICSRCQTRL